MKSARFFWFVLLFLGLMLPSPVSHAHELRPAYLELRETEPHVFDALWKVPAAGEDRRLALYVRLPENCVNLTEPIGRFSGGAHLTRWRVKTPEGLADETIVIDGLASTLTDALVRVEWLNGAIQIARLTSDSPSFVIQASPGGMQVAQTYTWLGVEHILGGIDHLLFVLALLLITRGGWKLIKAVTAFTVAHSITLGLATLGLVHAPSAPVEAIIALSIVFVAMEIMRLGPASQISKAGVSEVSQPATKESLTARAPWIVAFAFGLLHGFGFAGALSEVGLPQGHIPMALLFFNVGVEAGQLLFIGAVLGCFSLLKRIRLPLPRWAEFVPPYAIGAMAMFWVIQRVAGF